MAGDSVLEERAASGRESSPDVAAPAVGSWKPIALHASWLALLCVLLAPVVAALSRGWLGSIWSHGHGIFVPFASAYLGYRSLQRCPVKDEPPTAWGFALFVPGVLMVALDAAMQTEAAGVIGLLLIVPGLSLLLLGPRRTRALLFPIAILLLMIPVPISLTGPFQYVLRRISTEGTAWLLRLVGVPVFADGTVLHMERVSLSVIAECSGFSALYAAVTVGFVLAYLSHSWKRRILLVLIPWPLALGVNILRIFVLSLLAQSQGVDILQTPLHPASGWAVFLLACGLMFAFAERHRKGAA